MEIKEYKLKKEHIDGLDKIVDIADKWFYELERVTMHTINYDEELYEIYNSYIASLNEHMSTFLDVMKSTYDKLDMFKEIFRKNQTLYRKINISLNNIEKVFETYSYMLEQIQSLEQEYRDEYLKYNARNVSADYNETKMKQKFDYICPFHYELIARMNEFATEVAQPQVDIAELIYEHEMDFNKALNLGDL